MTENGGGKATPGKTSIEKMYQKKSQLEHILLRPDTYIGSVERAKEIMWVYEPETQKMIQKEIEYVPGLYKIFDEILVNAADNKQRDNKMNCIKIDINAETNTISVWNNGQGIPVVMHKDEKMFVPTMIFGHLLTSSNYNDEEQKVTGGRNGYGAKLCNIFSTEFIVETASRKYKQSFKQTWANNMAKASEPKLSDFRGEDFTKITFTPDLTKFKMEKLDDDIIGLMSRRAFDIAASSRGVSVFLNGTKLTIKNFKDYIDLYIKDKVDDSGNPYKVIYENVNDRWEVAVTVSERGFQQVSFVNSIATTKGGRHVDYVVDMIVKQLIEVLKKKNKGGIQIKPFQVKNHIWVFVNCLIVNPTFDSQTKENMTLQAKSFGSKCVLPEKFITLISKSGIVESVLTWAKFKAQTDLAKTSGKKNSKIKGIPKLEDANEAGTKSSLLCTLILTEGDSAKTLAVSGLGVVGRDHYGVFPLRGKLLNVREATHKQILENAEINNLIKILGLQYKKKYLCEDDVKTLRYGKCMIMTDQDQDGSHIKGLLINFIHTNWPELLRQTFLEEFITPIVKAVKKNEELSFYSLPEFEEWKADTPNAHTYNVKYYKGLGTSTSKEAKEYFQNMARHRILFKYDGPVDDESIVMAFAKKSVEQRKVWLTEHMEECKRRKILGLPERYLYTKTTKEISYADFVNLELVLFSNADNVRSISCSVDGLKPGQRKVLFTCIKRNDKREVKVAQLAGSIAEMSAYHHGEVSLCGTIVNLAQNYVGSNNINLLIPSGQFGTRLCGGKDSASPRYIFTMMSPLTRLIFHPHDDPLLAYQTDDNQRIEPVWYIPIIPMILVNGSEGIGTGWSTKIPNFNPRDLISNIRLMLQGEEPKSLHPWYKNFNGTVEYVSEHRYVTVGNVAILGENKIEITELPIGSWTQTYKENILEPLLHGSEKVKSVISDYKEYHTDTTVRFVVTFAPGEMSNLKREDGGFHRVFKLSSSLATSSMHAFDDKTCLRKFEHVNEILKEFYTLRLEYYVKRKEYLEGMLGAEAAKLTNQARFIMEKCDRTLVVENKKRKVMIDELIKRGYDADPVKDWKRKHTLEGAEEEDAPGEDEQPEEEVDTKKSKAPIDPEKAFQKLTDVKKYDYLLGMSMWMLTEEKKNDLLKQRDTKMAELNVLKQKTPKSIWVDDLDALEKKLGEIEEKERQDELGLNTKQAKALAKIKSASTKRKSGGQGDGDLFPTKNAIKIKFKVTDEMVKKMEKATAQARVKKEKPEGGAVATAASSIKVESGDEFDAMIQDGETKVVASTAAVKKDPVPRAKKDPKEPKARAAPKSKDNLKQSKLSFSAKKKNLSDDDLSDDEVIVPRAKTGSRAAATKKIDYAAIDAGSSNDDEDDPPMDDGSDSFVALSDSDEDGSPAKNSKNKSSDDLFNSLKSDDDDSPVSKGKRKLGPKAVEVKKPAAKRPRKKIVISDSDDSDFASKKKGSKKKKIESSDDDDFDF